jgi:hypothetical protein
VCPALTVTVQESLSSTTAYLKNIHETEPTEFAELITTDVSTTTYEVLPATTRVSSSPEKPLSSTVVDSSTACEIAETNTTGNAVSTTEVSTTTEEVDPATTRVSFSTEEPLSSTPLNRSTTDEFVGTTTLGNAVSTTDVLTTTEEVEPATRVSSSPEDLLLPTSVDSSTAGESAGTTSTGNAVSTTDVSATAERVFPVTTQVSSSLEVFLLPTSVDSSTTVVNTPHPKVYEAVIDYLNYTSLPPGCFERIDQRCLFSDDPEEFSCSQNEISKAIAIEFLVDFSLEIGGYLNENLEGAQSNASVIHTSTCQNSTELSWSEVIKVSSDKGTTINIERSPMFTAVSFLQLRTTSFGTSSVQLACQFVNGEALEFSSIVGGIVSVYTISKSRYDCSSFVTFYEVGISTVPGNLSTSSTAMNDYYDLPDDVGLPIEYAIVCIYIVLSYLAAFKAYRLHMKQLTRTDFKTNINLSFVILFLVWASGSLLYLLLFSAALTDTNFFYIKTVLTLTYFATYSGFTLIVHYRYLLDF